MWKLITIDEATRCAARQGSRFSNKVVERMVRAWVNCQDKQLIALQFNEEENYAIVYKLGIGEAQIEGGAIGV